MKIFIITFLLLIVSLSVKADQAVLIDGSDVELGTGTNPLKVSFTDSSPGGSGFTFVNGDNFTLINGDSLSLIN